ncbi:hypothetical protein LTR70_002802 [Exophiala xenobiotica]|uniref:GST N-terminal domain-containing protein n=1 Tax=Lithohypha guttulata TaxID=1690604 RepID=A0ABR0KIX4_9EURO|nr:hypothetical protein LTR24_002016 [Lithohypha guttulata]KAK5324518.1 hypothetical protein LTR70_002802 [Exophiala xenobiotica]
MAEAKTDQRPRQSTVAEHLAGTKDSWHGTISDDGPFKPEKDRYHMYIGLFCPFAHRANLVRRIKGLEDVIPMSIVYFKADPEYKGRYSVPALWDTKTNTMVNNESADLLRNFQTAFDDLLTQEGKAKEASTHLYPEHLREKIDSICEWMGDNLNSGVYKAGFAPDQETYGKNVIPVFAALNKLEKIVKDHGGPFALGSELTEVDIRLFPTLIRFDTVYVQHFKCNLGTIRHDYPVLNNYMKGMYWGENEVVLGDGSRQKVTAFGPDTVDFKHIKENYTKSHYDVNPKAITPRGPWPDIEKGFEKNWSRLVAGEVDMPEVLEQERQLPK